MTRDEMDWLLAIPLVVGIGVGYFLQQLIAPGAPFPGAFEWAGLVAGAAVAGFIAWVSPAE